MARGNCWWLVILPVLGLLGCQSGSGRERALVHVAHVEDLSRTQRVDLQALETSLQEMVADSDQLQLVDGEGRPGAYMAELIVDRVDEESLPAEKSESLRRSVVLVLTLTRWTDNNEKEKLVSTGSATQVVQSDPAGPGGFEQILEEAVEDAVRGIGLQLETRTLPADRLRAMLHAEDADDRLYVLRALRDRCLPDLYTDVMGLLGDPEMDVVHEAIGVLVQCRAREAVVPLIRLTKEQDPVFLMQIISALGEIQGPVAKGFLFTLSAGHPAERIRARSREVLSRIERREQPLRGTTGVPVAMPREPGKP